MAGDILETALGQGYVPTRMLYETPRQVRKWRELASTFSPASRQDDGAAAYREVHAHAVDILGGADVQLVGLACGDGRKEASLSSLLEAGSRAPVSAVLVEGSLPLIQLAATRVTGGASTVLGKAILADLDSVGPALGALVPREGDSRRAITLYGVLPGMDADRAISLGASLMGSGDILLISANSEPADSVASNSILEQYDNEPTRAWIGLMLEDLGIDALPGEIDFSIDSPSGNPDSRTIEATVPYGKASRLRVFRSARHGADALRSLIESNGLHLERLVVSRSGEETVAIAMLPPQSP